MLLLVGGRVVNRGALASDLKEAGVALLDRVQMQEVTSASDLDVKHRNLAKAFVESFGCVALSPYQPGLPVHGAKFFGRSGTVQHILSRRDASFTIIGNRRIGKTSLLREVRHRLFLEDPTAPMAELYGSNLDSTSQVLSAILTRLGLSDPREKFDPDKPQTLRFSDTIRNAAKTSRIAVFIDEVDHILELDELQDWEIMDTLRDTFHHPQCRLFLAGFRRTRFAKQQIGCPLYNFTESVELKRLTRDDAIDMITRPLKMLGLELTNSELPQAIYRESGGQPELIQIFGKHIVTSFAATGRTPDVNTLFADVLQSEELEQRISQTFLANTSPLEELLCYLVIDVASRSGAPIEDFSFAPALAYDLLKRYNFTLDMHLLTNLLRNLELSGIIVSSPGTKVREYQFSVPQLVRYCLSLDLELCIVSTLEKISAHATPTDALLLSPGAEEH